MRNLKRVLALAMAMVMILGMMVIGSSAASYTDEAAIDANYAEAIDVLSGMGVFKGQSTTSAVFAPKAVLTRAEAATLIYRVITGDVTDAQKQNYDYASLKDVKAGEWYTGYVTYANNGGYIKGDDQGNFNPYAQVTGVQVMAIMLRAIGYGQNGEYEGAGWKDNVLTDAKELGITGSISTATLDAPATREIVAQLIFNAIYNVKMVSYTPALGYIAANLADGLQGTTATLGWKVFGLTNTTGIVVGNQATGEKNTLIAADYKYANGVAFNTKTGLDMFGHAMKIWYNGKSVGAKTVYASYDKATKVEVIVDKTANLTIAGIVADAAKVGFDKTANVTTYASDAYGKIGTKTVAQQIVLNMNDCGIYVVISNSADLSVDMVIAADAYVDQLQAVNNFLSKPNALFATTGLIEQAKVENFAAATLGAPIIMEYVAGTASDASYYMVDTLNNATTSSVTGYNSKTGAITLSDGTVLEESPLAGTGILARTTNPTLVKGATYTFVLDNNGCYLYYNQNVTKAHFLATWMYYNYSGDLNDMYNYYIMGVNAAGEKVSYEIDYATYMKLLPKVYGQMLNGEGTSPKNTAIVDLTLVKGLYSGDVCNVQDAHTIIGDTLTDNAALTVTKGAQVVNNNYLVDENTTFYFVTGNASDLKVEAYAGTTALVGTGTSYTLPAAAMISLSEIKTSVIATGNYHVDTVVVYASYGYNLSGTMVYVPAGDPATGMIDLAGNVEIECYINGELVKIYVPAANYTGICNHVATSGHGQFFKYSVVGTLYTLTHNGVLTEDKDYDLNCGTATTGTIATIQVTDGTNFYDISAATKVVTLPGVTTKTGVAVSDYASFANLAEAVMTDLSTVTSISVDIALDGKGNVTTLYITDVTMIQPQK